MVVDAMGESGGIGFDTLLRMVTVLPILAATVWFLSRREGIGLPFSSWIPDGSGFTRAQIGAFS